MYQQPILNRLVFLTLSLFLPLMVSAQSSLKGEIRDKARNVPVMGATVTLYTAIDNRLEKTSIADKNGIFEFAKLPSGKYKLTISAVGFDLLTTDNLPFSGLKDSVIKTPFFLVQSPVNLKEVAIVSKKPLIEQRGDKIILNVESSITSVGGNALEVLEKSPGVSVDKDGNISLRGKQGVTIMIDGKPSYVSGADLTTLLSNLSASQLSQVEIISNPTAKFDAAGNAGIINLKTKKNIMYGFNGSITGSFGQGHYWRTDNSLNLNFRNEKINIYLNYGENTRTGFTELDINRTFRDAATGFVSSLYEQPSFLRYKRTSNNLKVGLNYFVSKNTTIGFVASGQLTPLKLVNRSDASFQDLTGTVDSTVHSESNTNGKWKNGSVNLNMEHHFDSVKTLTVDLDYLKYVSESKQQFYNTTLVPDGSSIAHDYLNGNLPVNICILSGKADYSQTFKSGIKMETGLKFSKVNTDNAADYLHQNGNDPILPDYSISNHFLYQENISALYINFNKQLKKWNFQLGVRYENTDYKGHQLGNPERADSSFKRNYDNLFPTAMVGYKFNEDHELDFSFGRRIDRPAYQDLNPFLYYINKYTYQQGNPLLLPQYSNNFNLTYLYKGRFTATLNYSKTSNYFSQLYRSQESITIFTQGNLSTLKTLGLSLDEELTVSDWWNMSLNGNITYKKVTGFVNGNFLETNAYPAQFGINNQITIAKGFSAELSGFYNTKDVDGQSTTKGFGQVSSGFSKQIFANKGTLKLNIRDIFYTQIIHGTLLYNNVTENFTQSSDSRIVNLSFTYRFGKKLKSTNRENKSSVDDEKGRVRN